MANIELPRDAEGREIPLDTELLYDSDGIEFFTDKSMYMRMTDEWWFFGHFGSSISTHRVAAKRLYLTPSDSWEKLEEDLTKCIDGQSACFYFSENATCRECLLYGEDAPCTPKMFSNILERIRNLNGENHVR